MHGGVGEADEGGERGIRKREEGRKHVEGTGWGTRVTKEKARGRKEDKRGGSRRKLKK